MNTKISRREMLRRAAMTSGGLYAASLFPGCASIHSSFGKTFRAGAYAIDITPTTFPISVNGMLNDRIATKAYDTLHARCLVLDDGFKRLAIVVVDSLLIPGKLLDGAKKRAEHSTKIPVANITICATHTHAAPSVTPIFQSEPDAKYSQFLADQIVRGIELAVKNLAPAKIGWTRTEDPTQTFCRLWRVKEPVWNPFGTKTDRILMHPGYQNPNCTEPAGPTDPEIVMLSVQSLHGKPIALLANYTMHYAQDEPYVSSDYFGEFCEQFKKLIGAEHVDPPFVGMLCNGAQGDAHCFDYSKPKQPRTRQSVAESVARHAHAAYKDIEYREWVPLNSLEGEVGLEVRLPKPPDIDKANQILAKAKGRELKGWTEIYARETVLLARYPQSLNLKLQALRIGEFGIAAAPLEMYASTGLRIKSGSPFKPTFVMDLANGYNGYMAPPEHFELGGYSTWRARSSYLEPNAEPQVVSRLLGMLHQMV